MWLFTLLCWSSVCQWKASWPNQICLTSCSPMCHTCLSSCLADLNQLVIDPDLNSSILILYFGAGRHQAVRFCAALKDETWLQGSVIIWSSVSNCVCFISTYFSAVHLLYSALVSTWGELHTAVLHLPEVWTLFFNQSSSAFSSSSSTFLRVNCEELVNNAKSTTYQALTKHTPQP